MLSKLRPRLTYANVVSSVCLFILLGGTAFAAAKAITGKEVNNGSLSGKDVRNSSLTGLDVKNESLSPDDFNGSVLGPKGDTGPRPEQGVLPGAGRVHVHGTRRRDQHPRGAAVGLRW